MASVPSIALNDGRSIPQFGLGVWKIPNDDAPKAVEHAIKVGYRHIDTAAIYGNEEGVGKGIKASGVPRDQLFITTKLWNHEQGLEYAPTALEESLKKLDLDYVDLYLIHWPVPSKGRYVDSWKALVQSQKDGKAKSIGVSNFSGENIDKCIEATGVTPAVNQIELHPFFQQNELVKYGAEHKIATEPWSPLAQGVDRLQVPALIKLAEKYQKSIAQVVLRWHTQKGYIVFPKSATPSRIEENVNIFDFALDDADIKEIDALDRSDGRVGPDPAVATFGARD